jgi:hypothetical protein
MALTPLDNALVQAGVTMTHQKGSVKPKPPLIGRDMTSWTVTLHRAGKKFTTPFYTGSAIRDFRAADVVHSLVSDAVGISDATSFEDWASDYGYDSDSLSAYKTFQALKAQAPRVRSFFGEHFDAIAKAAQEY